MKFPLRKLFFRLLIFVLLTIAFNTVFSQQRFPKPEFENGYVQPDTTTPEPRSTAVEYVDVAVLLAVLSLITWFALRRRSRRGILWLSVFTLVYFGFYRNGCICPIGAVQNVSLSIFSPHYAISYTVLAFFLIPLIFSLFAGRVFCAGACPLGAIQDLVIISPVSVPAWLRRTLGMLPFVYLGLAILFAATGSDFIICRYDPFVGIFRMGATFTMIVLGIGLLLIGMFVARPYCRFLCPYGGILRITSYFSSKHLSITPGECIQCKLCTTSCPFDAIESPTGEKENVPSEKDRTRFIVYAALIPIWVFLGGFALAKSSGFLSKAHPDVYLANLLVSDPEIMKSTENLDVKTFMASGKTLDALVEEAKSVRSRFYTGSWILGGFLGLVFGIILLNQVIYRKKTDYNPDKSNCLSCGRCLKYCPVKDT